MTDNIRPALYGSKYESWTSSRKEEELVTVCGKCCESGYSFEGCHHEETGKRRSPRSLWYRRLLLVHVEQLQQNSFSAGDYDQRGKSRLIVRGRPMRI